MLISHVKSRGRYTADCVFGGNNGCSPAGIWQRFQLHAATDHQHAEFRQCSYETDCKYQSNY